MKTRTTEISIKLVFGALLLALAFSAQAEGFNKITAAPTATEETHTTISTVAVLKHNKRLLDNTTIGKNLQTSEKQRVRNLYKRAYNIFLAAADAYESGLEKMAKELSHKSISIFYAADKAHYNIVKNF